MFNWLVGFVTLPILLAFILGAGTGQGISGLVNHQRVKQGKAPKPSGVNAVIGMVIVLTMVWIMISTQQARNCAITLNISVSREQEAATLERNGFQHAIQESLNLPPDIQALPTNDPRRKAMTDPITAEYLKQVNMANEIRHNNQAAVDKARKACGQ